MPLLFGALARWCCTARQSRALPRHSICKGCCNSRSAAPAPCTQNRYLIILYYNATRHKGKLSLKEQEAELRRMQEKHGVDGEQRPAGKK